MMGKLLKQDKIDAPFQRLTSRFPIARNWMREPGSRRTTLNRGGVKSDGKTTEAG
jgi:hypothetical protein